MLKVTRHAMCIISLTNNSLYHHILVICICRASEQKLVIMAPVLLTALNKIIAQPSEVFHIEDIVRGARGKVWGFRDEIGG